MNFFNEIFVWLSSFFLYGSMAVNWLLTPFQIGSIVITPLGLLSVSGVVAFIPVVITKWIIN